ncbi:hypothetical protein NOVOSPHI9U_10351 [Novosphingobium sp. 9U]|nr:hypothetical protein NOVOSPHI9U_10351 [Novosphingobium sp. 9U]
MQDQHLRAAEQRGVQLEAGVLSGGAHQRHGTALYIRQETVLLRAVEAMDLVHEQQGALPRLGRGVGFGEDLAQFRDAREHRTDRGEAHAHRVGEQARDAGLAGARRPPQHHGGQAARRHHAADRAFGTGQMLLPDHLAQILRAQAVGKGGVRTRRLASGVCGLRGQVVGEEIGHGAHLAIYHADCIASALGVIVPRQETRAWMRRLAPRGRRRHRCTCGSWARSASCGMLSAASTS